MFVADVPAYSASVAAAPLAVGAQGVRAEPLFRVGYLPGLHEADIVWRPLALGAPGAALTVLVPQLSAAQLHALAATVRAGSARLKTWAVADIVRVLDAAVARLLNEQDTYRQQLDRLLPAATGFDAEMLRLGLNAYLRSFRALQLQRFVVEDFANPALLDAFQPRVTGGWSRAFGPELLIHIWAGNVPALPLWSLVAGLLVKAGSIGKVASDEPVFATVFARLLAELEPRLADCLAVVWWPGGDTALEAGLLAQAEVVLAYGGDAALRALQRQVGAGTRFLPHGHKLSVGLVWGSALSPRRAQVCAQQAALDVARYDQQGCYSPQVFYVQRGARVSPREFAERLAAALAALHPRFAPRALSLAEAAAIAAWRSNHELQAVQHGSRVLLGAGGAHAAVVYADAPLPLTPGPLNRQVLVVAVDGLADLLPLLASQRVYLQSAGVAAAPEELLLLADALGGVGVTRVCALGAMTAPAPGWHHDGRFSLLDLVRMVDIEASTEAAAQAFAAYEP